MSRLKNMLLIGQKLYETGVCQLLVGVCAVAIYIQDILQDILLISAATTSQETYNVLSYFHISEKYLGFSMAFVFGIR